MHANDDSLGVRSASVSGSDAEGRPFEVRQSARPTFFIWPRYNPVLKFSEVSRGDCRPLWIKLPGVAGGLHDSRGSDRRLGNIPTSGTDDAQGRWYRNKKSEDEKAE
jgi:hypothetical protein